MKALSRSILNSLGFYPLYGLKKGILQESGWLLSFQLGQPVDQQKKPIPWMTYSFISFLEGRVKRSMDVFEYGCGNSTLWWASRVSSVISCEHDLEWFEKVREKIPANVSLHHIPLKKGGLYSKKVAEYEKKFDIVVIDGRDRVNCALHSLGSLKVDGVIIWDNSDRKEYQEGYQFLLENRYKRLDFFGMGPINPDSWCTSVFYQESNCLGI